SWPRRGCRRRLRLERVLRYFAAFDDEADVLRVREHAYVGQWVAIDEDDVGKLTLFHRADAVLHAEEPGVQLCRADDRGHGAAVLRAFGELARTAGLARTQQVGSGAEQDAGLLRHRHACRHL